jgi:uncharacterized membrane protein/3-hydroxymyristoyl/3-hydroxydecanoyl-(acyl carrier protein) dehydratase
VAYPLLAHGASLLRSPALTIASVAVLAAAILIRPLSEDRRWAWFALPAAALVIVGLWRIDAAALVLLLPPVLLNAFLAWLFGHTLARGSVPLIERLVRLLQPPGEPPEPAIVRYAGRLTQAWTALFTVLAAVNLGLAACAVPGGLLESMGVPAPAVVSRQTWSLFANVLNYAIVAAFFLLEYAYRRRSFPGRPYRNLADFLRRALAAGPALAATLGAAPAGRNATEPAKRDSLEITRDVPMEHPSFAGHFPGHPVLPGVVLLEWVIEAAGVLLGGPPAIAGMPRVKFLSPLAPGDSASIRVRRERELLHFEVHRGAQRVAQGVFRIADGGTTG